MYLLIFLIFIGYLGLEFWWLRREKKIYKEKIRSLEERHSKLLEEIQRVAGEIEVLEQEIQKVFLIYETTRILSSHLQRKSVLEVFSEKLRYFGQIEDISISDTPKRDYLNFPFPGQQRFINIRTSSTQLMNYLPPLVNQLALCLERIDLYERLQHLSIYDSLTEIPNRRHFMLRFYEEFERAQKFHLRFSLLIADIDHFKKINDTYGHVVGDGVLKQTAHLLKENVREIDFVARLGGEEFAILLPETDKGGAILVGERIVNSINRSEFKVFDEHIHVTISVGVATYPENALNSDMLLETADKALYKAKQEGRNKVCWF